MSSVIEKLFEKYKGKNKDGLDKQKLRFVVSQPKIKEILKGRTLSRRIERIG